MYVFTVSGMFTMFRFNNAILCNYA